MYIDIFDNSDFNFLHDTLTNQREKLFIVFSIHENFILIPWKIIKTNVDSISHPVLIQGNNS